MCIVFSEIISKLNSTPIRFYLLFFCLIFCLIAGIKNLFLTYSSFWVIISG